MNRVLTLVLVAATGAVFMGAQVRATDVADHSTLTKRQMAAEVISCMRKRMSAGKTITYYAAMKLCKDQVNRQTGDSPSDSLLASDAAKKP